MGVAMICRVCGSPDVPDGSRFCPNCGTRFATAEAAGHLDFSQKIERSTRDFTGRAWVFEAVDRWLGAKPRKRVLHLTGRPGSGKSAIAARLAQISQGAVSVEGCPHLVSDWLAYAHFCEAGKDSTLSPLRFVEALSLNLANRYDKFREALLEARGPNITIYEIHQEVGTSSGVVLGIGSITISGTSARAAFDRWVRQPLEALCQPGFDQEVVVLADGLDEALGFDPDNDLVSLLHHALQGEEQADLPAQVRFVFTCRSEELRVLDQLPGEQIDLIDDLPEGPDDLEHYAYGRLWRLEDPERREMAEQVAKKGQGNFLYVSFVLDDLLEPGKALPSVAELDLPETLQQAYHRYLDRARGHDLARWETQLRPTLGALAVARAPGLKRSQVRGAAGLSEPSGDDALKRCSQFLVGRRPDGPFRFYHESFRDFLRGGEDADFKIYPATANESVARFFLGEYGTAWLTCPDDYALQFTPAHLLDAARLAELNKDRRRLAVDLEELLTDRSFRQAKIGRWGSPAPYLADLRFALELALDQDDVVWTWQYPNTRQQTVSYERQPSLVLRDVSEGKWGEALDRTALYGGMPNSQGLMRLWIAWNAARQGQPSFATQAATLTLDQLPPRAVISQKLQHLSSSTAGQTSGALAEELLRLVLRLARTLAPSPGEQEMWLRRVARAWPADEVMQIARRVEQPLSEWAPPSQEAGDTSLQSLIQELPMLAFSDGMQRLAGEGAYYYQARLAASLYAERHHPGWLAAVDQLVGLLALDDYPSYREMALAWVGTAVLAHEDDGQACAALGQVLSGALSIPEPVFGGDALVAALAGLASERGARLRVDDLADALRYTPSAGASRSPTEDEMRASSGLPLDPWSYEMRRQCAVAATLHRQDGPSRLQAEQLLDQAGSVGHEGSYAGYRVLSRLALACRWLEWQKLDRAREQVAEARMDADNMLDPVLGQERREVVDAMDRWLTEWELQPSIDGERALRQVADMGGMLRSLRLQFLAAVRADDAQWLKYLARLALDDATALDAILGRLYGVLAGSPQADEPFGRLIQAMGAEDLASRFIVS